jgi:ABC-type dipeptide/oligopeptide/nickel transport system ATPase component
LAPLLSIDGLRTEIRLRKRVVHAIDGVSLSVNPGECLGIVGESGSGTAEGHRAACHFPLRGPDAGS